MLGHVYVAGQTGLSVSAQMGCELRDGGGTFCLRILRQPEELAEACFGPPCLARGFPVHPRSRAPPPLGEDTRGKMAVRETGFECLL